MTTAKTLTAKAVQQELEREVKRLENEFVKALEPFAQRIKQIEADMEQAKQATKQVAAVMSNVGTFAEQTITHQKSLQKQIDDLRSGLLNAIIGTSKVQPEETQQETKNDAE